MKVPHRLAVATVIAVVVSAATARAGVIHQPVAVSTNMPIRFSVDLSIDQSGLSTGYVSGVTDFDTYIASNPTHDLLDTTHFESNSTPTGNVDFDLGGATQIESFMFWNRGSGSSLNVTDFTLLADDNSSFSSPDTLGTFNPTTSGNPVPAQVFTFAPTLASFVRMQINSNNGGSAVAFSEAAFEATPEPSTFVLMGLGLAGMVGYGWRKRKRGKRETNEIRFDFQR